MKTRIVSLKSLVMTLGLLMAGLYAFAQQPALQYFRYNDKRGLNVYETSKEDSVGYDGVKVRVGGDFAIQYQGLSQENTAGNLRELESNFNLPTANLNLDGDFNIITTGADPSTNKFLELLMDIVYPYFPTVCRAASGVSRCPEHRASIHDEFVGTVLGSMYTMADVEKMCEV